MRITISGSDHADGTHRVPFAPFSLAITGSEWTIKGERLEDRGEWRPHNVVSTSRWDPQAGMRLTLDWSHVIFVEPEPGFLGLASRHTILLDCVSDDPLLQAIPVSPPDFSLPGE
jgi:hypothetical protein